MVLPVRRKLAVAVPYLGRPTETYVRAHINGLARNRRGITIVFFKNVEPVWWPKEQVVEMYGATARGRTVRMLLGRLSAGMLRRWDQMCLGGFLVRHNVDVIVAEYLQLAVSIVPIAAKLGIRVIGHAHGYDVSAQPQMPGWRDVYMKALPKLSAIVVVSESMKERLVALGAPSSRVAVIPCGVAIPRSRSAPKSKGLRFRGYCRSGGSSRRRAQCFCWKRIDEFRRRSPQSILTL
jgi:hypothetical protein